MFLSSLGSTLESAYLPACSALNCSDSLRMSSSASSVLKMKGVSFSKRTILVWEAYQGEESMVKNFFGAPAPARAILPATPSRVFMVAERNFSNSNSFSRAIGSRQEKTIAGGNDLER